MPKKLNPDQVKINFNLSPSGELSVIMETLPKMRNIKGKDITVAGLIIRSTTADDVDNYYELFSDSDVMQKYATGKTVADKTVIEARINGYVAKWKSNNPFSGFAVYEKDSGKFVGHAIAGGSDEGKGASEVAYLFHKDYWGRGVGSIVASALVNCYIPRVMMRNYELNHYPLNKLVATTRTEHFASQKILEKVGLAADKTKINYKFGAERYLYSASAKEIRNEHAHFYNKKDTVATNPEISGSDIDMALSAFGQSSNIAKSWQQKVSNNVKQGRGI